jgi:predicted nuclease of predicted toxin-antitoxin system
VKFLIDECLHTSLTQVANTAGHEAHHVIWRGWSGLKDHELREVILGEEFVFVTNNARDFRKLMAETELHAGLIVLVPNVRPAFQRDLFHQALVEVARFPDMINCVVEIDSDQVRVYELPKLQ